MALEVKRLCSHLHALWASVRIEIRWRTGRGHQLPIPYYAVDQIEQMRDWCRETIPDRFRFVEQEFRTSISYRPIGSHSILFKHELDLVHFRLAWSEVLLAAERRMQRTMEASMSVWSHHVKLGGKHGIC